MKSINTSISTFSMLVESGYLYVDKTKTIYEMVREPFGQYFFSRPRRFGKSLTVSTLEAIFSGEKELFRDCYIFNSDYSWDVYPIIHIDFGQSDSSTVSNLEEWLKLKLLGIAKKHDVETQGSTPALMFGELINALYNKYNKGVVVLIDEYDRPITNNLEDGKGVKLIGRTMEAFYQIVKGYESMERFVFITGITRLSQVSIFSKLNNLLDISTSTKYSDLVGYNSKELEEYFDEHIKSAAEKHGFSYDEMLKKLADWYDGFRFSFEGEKVYNPVSVGRFFMDNYEFKNYWYATATPVLLMNLARKQKITIEGISNALVTEISLNSFDIMALSENNVDSHTVMQLLLQTGYLTIGDRIKNNNIPTYRLVYPNREVQLSFETDLASVYTGKAISEINTITSELQNAAFEGDAEKMVSVLKGVFAGVPYGIQLKYEKYYQSLLYLVFKMCGMRITAESMTNIGRVDATLETGNCIYIIECKIDKSAEEAMLQIKDKGYAEQFSSEMRTGKKLILIGMNFSSDKDKRNIDDHIVNVL